MKREEFKKHIRNLFYSSKTVEKYLEQAYADIDKIFDEHSEQLQNKDDEIELLKHRIEEAMKPKTCVGCRYGAFGVDSFGLEIECTLAYRCSRGQDDMFKQKDNK